MTSTVPFMFVSSLRRPPGTHELFWKTGSLRSTSTAVETFGSGSWSIEFLHRSADGRFLCRMCLTLEGGNRAAPLQPVTRRKTHWLPSPAFSAREGMDCSGSRPRPNLRHTRETSPQVAG